MKEIIAIIRPNKMAATKEVLTALGFPAMTAHRVMGRGKQKAIIDEVSFEIQKEELHKKEGSMRYIPKRLMMLIVPDEDASLVVEAIMRVNQTGQIGDGKIFVCPVDESMPNGDKFPIDNFNLKYITGTDIRESDVVFGGMDKLKKCILEANKEFPEANAIYTYATCTTGLIGDDIDAVSREVAEEIGKDVIPINAPGFAGPTQSKGHHFKEMGINILSTFSGDCCHDEIGWMHRAKLSLVRCQRSSNYIAKLLKERYDIPYIKVDFFGVRYPTENLRALGEYFGKEEEAEKVIESRMKWIRPELDKLKEKLQGKKVWVFSGGPKNWHLPEPLEEELGMEVVAVSTMFEHEDGYEKIKERVGENTVIIDDPNSLEAEEIIEKYKPDIVLSGVKEKYLAHKMGVPCILIHSYENGPYIGFEGFLNLAKDMYAAIYNPVWKLLEFEPEIEEEIATENTSDEEAPACAGK